MKRILSIFTLCASLLVLFAQASWAADGDSGGTASYLLQEGETHAAGDAVAITDAAGTQVATLTFGFAGEADYAAAKADGQVEGFVAFTAGNGSNGSESSGTVYILNPVYDGQIEVGVVLNANKKFFILEDGTALEGYDGMTLDAKTYTTFQFQVKGGSTYKVFCTGSKLGFYGFYYTYGSESSGGGEVTPAQEYTLTVGSTPQNAGYTDPSGSQQVTSGSQVYVYTYGRSNGYQFKHWTANGVAVNTSSSFYYTMPAENVQLMAVYDYNPNSPADPQVQGKQYQLTLTSSPNNAGDFNHSNGEKFEAGTEVYLYAYNRSGYKFDHWESADTVMSRNRSFYFTMPAKDITVKGVYTYDPSSPADPEAPRLTYKVTLNCEPANAGNFYWNTVTEVQAGTNCSIYTYPNSGYQFREWRRKGEVVSTSQNYTFEMPSEHVQLTAVFDYNPQNPVHPNSNLWNPETGEVIVDDFTTGYLYSTIENLIGGWDNRSQVQMITVQGVINENDWHVVRNYPNCSFLDMSRTSGVSYVPSWCFESCTGLTTIALPQSLERIDYYAFYNCSNLSTIYCHAITPPVLDSNAFSQAPDGLVIYVPAFALSQYLEADGWKDLVANRGYTILPLGDQVSAIEVNMPENTDMSLYKDMYIELINTKSGQKQRYVITDRITYTFSSLVRRTTYNAYLKNALGDILGQISDIQLDEQDVSVTFENLMTPRTVTLSVQTPAGEDVTAQTTITWLNEKDAFLLKGSALTSQLEGRTVKALIQLPQSLAMQYVQPTDTVKHEVTADNALTYTLAAIPQLMLTGKVMDVKTELPMSGATVAVSQMVNGLYSKSYSTKTNAQGEWSQTVQLAPTEVTASQTDYVSQSVTLTTDQLQESTEVPTFNLKDINGTAIQLTLTYQPVEGELQNYYSDYANVTFTVIDETTKQQVTDLNVQYPQIVLMESLPEGTELTVTATSKNQKFMPVSVKAAVDANDRVAITLPVVQLGGINASFAQTDNNSIVGILYNSDGRLVKKYDYNGTTLQIAELQDGEYTLVTMANSQFFNSVANISQFADAGLREGVDFLKNKVTVQSGAYTRIYNAMIPYLDETKLYYTGTNTSIALNRSQITVGNYLTVNSRVDFKNAYAGEVSDVKLIFTLPEESSFVANSVMAGNNTSAYTSDGQQIVVPLENLNDRVRFCFIPTVGGENAVSASVQFTLGGKEMRQPIGSAGYTAKDLSISVPSVVAQTAVPVSGTAPGKSTVAIYDNGVMVGQTTSLANGAWATTIELVDAYNLSKHKIYAKLTNQQGVEMQSATQTVTYDANAIMVSKVVMYHNNPEMNKTYEVIFDFLNPTTVAQKYTYYIYNKVFTFTLDFTANDPEKVTDVVLFVKTGDGSWNPLSPVFDTNKGQWIVSGEFGNMYDGNIPKNVAVQYTYAGKVYFAATDVYANFDMTTGDDLKSELDAVDGIFANELDEAGESTLDDLLTEVVGVSEADTFDYESASEAELEALLDETIAKLETYDFSSFVDTPEDAENGVLRFGNYSVKKSTCDGQTAESLIAAGWREMPVSDSESVFVLRSESAFGFASLTKNMMVEISAEAVLNTVRRASDGEKLWNWESLLLEQDLIDKAFNEQVGKIKDFHKEWQKARRIKKMCDTRGFTNGSAKWDAAKQTLKGNIKGAAKNAKYLKYLKPVAKVVPFVDVAINGAQAWDKYQEVNKILGDIPTTCSIENFEVLKANLQSMAQSLKNSAAGYYTTNAAASHGAGMAVGALGVAFPPSLIVTVPAVWYAQLRADDWFDKQFDKELDYLRSLLRQLRRKCGMPADATGHGQESGCEDADPSIDPSGFVYEAVSSNRVQGATATAYYKEIVEDMYGDQHENIVLWNAEEYAQENPLFTDENGMYRWDVPQGLWQVKFEKEGYQTTYSEWLPVPPPQLEVNIPMTQLLQPTVKSVKAHSAGIDIEFDKYMNPETLTTDNITATKNGSPLGGTIKLLNEEVTYEGETQTYASKVQFQVASEQPLLQTDEVVLTVKRQVKSYAGVPMEADYTTEGQLDVELLVTSVAAEQELVNVAYGGTRTVKVAAVPVDAAKGKKVDVTSLSSMIATTNVTELTLDENGEAELIITGELPGSTSLSFMVKNTDVKGQMTVNVKDGALLKTMEPRASRVSGTQVYRGAKIQLSCETENAVIYYTLDGTCPCDGGTSVLTYNPDEPIVIADDNVTIKAMAKGMDLEDSEVMEFTYSLKKTNLNYVLPAGWLWISHNLETAVPFDTFVEGTSIERIMSRTQETVKDSQWGFFGDLTELQPATGYKVWATAQGEKPLSGNEYNAQENTVSVVAGWSWIGYPLNQVMTVAEALAYFEATNGDMIVGQDGFAEYDGSAWVGSLEGLKPGQAYMFKSATSADISFNTNIVSNAVSQIGKRNLLMNSPWAYNKYAYKNVMPVTAELYSEGSKVADGDYLVGAFAGDECRGVGLWKDGRLLITVYGDGNEQIRFVAAEMDGEKFYDITETVSFTADNRGSWFAPLSLTLGSEATGMMALYDGLTVKMGGGFLTLNAGGKNISRLTLTNMKGINVLSIGDLGTGGTVATGHLQDGVYIVTVVADGQTYYKKILKANK